MKTLLSIASVITASSFVIVAKFPRQVATCWEIFSYKTDSEFVTDGAVNSLVEIDPIGGSLIGDMVLSNSNTALTDLVAAGDFVYALSPGDGTNTPAVVVTDVSRGSIKQVQNFLHNASQIQSHHRALQSTSEIIEQKGCEDN